MMQVLCALGDLYFLAYLDFCWFPSADFSAILASVTSRLGLIANQASPVNLDTTVEHFQQALQLDQLSVSQYFASKKLEASAWSVDHLNEICTGMLNSSLLPHQVHDRLSVITASRTQLAASLKRAGAFQNALQHLEAAVCSTESEFELYLQLLPLVEHDMRFFSNDSSDSNFAPIPVDGFVAFSSLQSHLCKTFKSSEFVSAIHSTKVALLSCISQLATLHLQIAQIYELAGATSLAAVSASKSLDMIEMVDKHSADLRWSILSPSLAASASRALVSEAMQSNEQQQLWDALALMDASRLRLQISGACAAYADCCQVCALLLCRIGQFDRFNQRKCCYSNPSISSVFLNVQNPRFIFRSMRGVRVPS
jgi:tetratricopeptide (TPR) repeat protein